MDDLLFEHSYDCENGGDGGDSGNGLNGLNIYYPDSYRCRGRIGRNGRLVTDRIPIYKSNVNTNANTIRTHTDHSINVVYGTVLKNKQSLYEDVGAQLQVPTLPLSKFNMNYNYTDIDSDEYQLHSHNYMNHTYGNVVNQTLHSHDGYELYRLNMKDIYNYPHIGEKIHMKLNTNNTNSNANGDTSSNTNIENKNSFKSRRRIYDMAL